MECERFSLGMAHSWHGGLANDEEVDKIAEAVMTLNRSGLFKVIPVDDDLEGGSDGSEEKDMLNIDGVFRPPRDAFVTGRRARVRHPGQTVGYFGLPKDTASPPLLPPSSFTTIKNSALHTSTPATASLTRPPIDANPNMRDLPNFQLPFSNVQLLNQSQPCNLSPPPSAEMVSLFGRVPRIPTFSGSTSKADTSFESWKFEVKCLMNENSYNKDLLLQGVRKSLRGEAGTLCMHLGEHASIEDILRKLEGVYGIVERGTTLLQQFYNAKQEGSESVAEYGCRLEEIVNRAISRGAVAKEQANEMLRSKLWTGLKDERVRNATRHKYDMIHDFDALRAELRAMEQEIKELDCLQNKNPKHQRASHMPQIRGEDTEDPSRKSLDELKQKVKTLEEKVSRQSDTTKLLNRILEKVEKMEKNEQKSNREGENSQAKGADSSSSNSKGPLVRDVQRAQGPAKR